MKNIRIITYASDRNAVIPEIAARFPEDLYTDPTGQPLGFRVIKTPTFRATNGAASLSLCQVDGAQLEKLEQLESLEIIGRSSESQPDPFEDCFANPAKRAKYESIWPTSLDLIFTDPDTGETITRPRPAKFGGFTSGA